MRNKVRAVEVSLKLINLPILEFKVCTNEPGFGFNDYTHLLNVVAECSLCAQSPSGSAQLYRDNKGTERAPRGLRARRTDP